MEPAFEDFWQMAHAPFDSMTECGMGTHEQIQAGDQRRGRSPGVADDVVLEVNVAFRRADCIEPRVILARVVSRRIVLPFVLPLMRDAPAVREKAPFAHARRANVASRSRLGSGTAAVVMFLHGMLLASESAATSIPDSFGHNIAVPSPPARREARKIAILAAA
jgi:hypothetical protein